MPYSIKELVHLSVDNLAKILNRKIVTIRIFCMQHPMTVCTNNSQIFDFCFPDTSLVGGDKNTVGEVGYKYVAFCDLLGFSNAILTDFDTALEIYKDFNEELNGHRTIFSNVSLFSDAVVITSDSLEEVCSAVQILYAVCLKHGFFNERRDRAEEAFETNDFK